MLIQNVSIIGIRFPCDLCSYAATRTADLKKHKENIHEVFSVYPWLLIWGHKMFSLIFDLDLFLDKCKQFLDQHFWQNGILCKI